MSLNPLHTSATGSPGDDSKDMILESMSQGVAVWSAGLELAAFNQHYIELMQFPPGFIRRGMSYAAVIRYLYDRGDLGTNKDFNSYLRSRVEAASQKAIERHLNLLPDLRILEVQRRPMPDGGFVSTFTDVTELKRAEEEVEHKSGLLSATLNVMNQGLVIYDPEQRLQLFNEGYVRLFSFPPGFINLGMSYEQVLSYLLAVQGNFNQEERLREIAHRVEGARLRKPHRNLHRRSDGTAIAVNRVPLPDGGFVITFADVTTEMNATDEVRKTSALLKATQDNMLQGICVHDKDFKIVNINRRFLELYEVPEQIAHIGADFFGILAYRARRGDYGDGNPDELAQIRFERHCDPFLRQYEQRLPSNRVVLTLRNPLMDGGYVITSTDVTDQREAEQEIRRQASLLRSTFDAVSQGITVYDRDFRLTAYNSRYVEMFGFPSGFIHPGIHRADVIRHHAERGEYGICDVDEITKAKMDSARRNEHYRNEYVRPNGTALSVSREPMPDGGCVITFTDITRSRAREARLKESEERYALAMRGSNEGLWDWDIPRNEVYLSPRVREIANFDFMASRMPAGRWLTFIHSEDAPAYRDAIGAHFRGETEFFQCEYRILGSDNVYRWVLDRGLALRGPDGRVHRMAGSIGDISPRKEAERRIVEAKEAAELANRAKTDFLANISHELRTPLNAIIGFSEVMRDELFGPVENERYRNYLRDIHESGSHLLCLINDILDVAKAEAGKIELIEEAFDVTATVESCTRLVQERAQQGLIALTVEVADGLPMLWADQRKMRQVILNILSNSVKFTPEGGCIKLSATADMRNGLVIAVSDTGIGIAEEDIVKALSAFGQVDSSLSRKHNGTGLGLPLSKALAEAHGGTLTIDSKVGHGTCVRVTLPSGRLRPQLNSIAAAG
jgi:PAS domain S-box-containing protein